MSIRLVLGGSCTQKRDNISDLESVLSSELECE